jgi:AcrR family transcriptional regulator
MIRVVGTKGYTDASVADVLREADASRTTFYKHFDDKQACFLAAYETLVEQVFDEVTAGCDRAEPWVARMRAGLNTLVSRFARDPALARTAVIEAAAAGPAARRLQWNAIASFTEFLDGGRELAGNRALPESISLMSAGAVFGLIFDELLAGREAELTDRLPDLLFAMLVPYLGPEAAAAEMRPAGGAH